MGNFQNVLKTLRKSRGLTQDELSKILKISRSTIGMYENGSREPDYEMLETIADYFNVDIDYLIGRTNKTTFIPLEKEKSPELTARDERDIAKILEQTKEQLLSQEGLMFDGDPASPEAINSILDAMQIGMEMAKKKNKEKYSPKNN